MEHCKLQIGCLVSLLYLAFIYFRQIKKFKFNLKDSVFDELLILGIFSVFFDGATAFTVNRLDTVDPILNMVLHALFFIGMDTLVFLIFLFMLNATGFFPQKMVGKLCVCAPYLVNIAIILFTIHSIEYRIGNTTNYSAGVAVYTCFIMTAVYIVMTFYIFFRRWNRIAKRKRVSVVTYLMVLTTVLVIQMIFHETLITSLGITVCIFGVYFNLEDPAIKELRRYHEETIMSFSNLIETRDNNTGGHIRRTSAYVSLIAEELSRSTEYKNLITSDYMNNLRQAAPMHDIGKIAVPDAILQKPGRLTNEEFEQMKLHAAKGGELLKDAFENLGDEEYRNMAYLVARHHHEKWNGKGYPDGLSGSDIPLCARIMAVADVFDAVSEKRCYRDAMPLEQCFSIIENGVGTDFDPIVANAFLNIRDKVETVHAEFNKTQKNMS